MATKLNTQKNLSNVSVNLLTCKMLQSKKDGRLAFVKKIDGDFVYIEMDRIGERKFHVDVIENGFGYILDNHTLVKSFFFNRFSPSAIFGEESIFLTACEIYDALSGRFPDLTNQDVLFILKRIAFEIDVKSGL